jgi:hypothetical protein
MNVFARFKRPKPPDLYRQTTLRSPSLLYDISFTDATAMLTDLTKARQSTRTELNVKTTDGGQQISGLVDCVATLAFVLEDFALRIFLPTRTSKIKTHVRLAN